MRRRRSRSRATEAPTDATATAARTPCRTARSKSASTTSCTLSGFARLPVAESKKYPAKDIPFQIRNWDSRIREYFELADRIGHRNIGLWGDSGWDFVESLGDNWYTGGFAVDVERNGWKNTTPEQVYKKTFDLVSKHKDDKFWFICQGNEPNEKPEKAKEKVEAYEQVYKAAHAAKPDITVVATSVPALDCFFKEGFGKWCDVYDFHVYETYENVRQGVRRYREMGRKYGCEKPVWCTELGLNSQGQTRYAVAQEVVKKITAFFAEGGASVSWFTIQYPDKEGRARGTGGDCHNTFDCQYCLYNPRLDAIMYYTMINNVTVKKVVDEVQHEDGVQEYLFRDKEGDSFLVLWKEGERVDRGVSLPTAKDIVLTRVDGSKESLAAANGVVTLGLSGEPVMLRYRDSADKLARREGRRDDRDRAEGDGGAHGTRDGAAVGGRRAMRGDNSPDADNESDRRHDRRRAAQRRGRAGRGVHVRQQRGGAEGRHVDGRAHRRVEDRRRDLPPQRGRRAVRVPEGAERGTRHDRSRRDREG